MFEFSESEQKEGLTRISVQSSGDSYVVRHGNSAPVRVRRRGARLDCECRQWECVHITSLRLCGFIGRQDDEMPMAA